MAQPFLLRKKWDSGSPRRKLRLAVVRESMASGAANPEITVAAEAALNTYVQRSAAMQEKLKTITPPPGCERVHILFSEVAGVGVESVRVMQEIVDDGFFATETTLKMEMVMAQVNSVVTDLDSAQGECR